MSNKQHRVLFVCHGNICRSPMAEFVLKNLVEKRGVSSSFTVASCATSAEEIPNGIGRPMYGPAKQELDTHGIPYTERKAQQLRASDYDRYDVIACMDDANVRNSTRILGGDPQQKVKKLLSFAGSERDVADPWYTGNFDIAYADILEGCTALLETLLDT